MDSAFMYLDDLLEKKEPIYVRNVSKKPTRGIVVLTLNDNGRTHREAIPATKYPVCLSRKATPDMIRNSSSLRQFIDAGALELVPFKAAEAELQEEGAVEALQTAYEAIGYKNRDLMRMRKRSDDEIKVIGDANGVPVHNQLTASVAGKSPEPFSNEYDDDIPLVRDEETSNPAVRVQYLVEALASKDMKSRAVKAELMGLELTRADLAFIIDNTSGIVQKYAKEQLAELRDSGDNHIEQL